MNKRVLLVSPRISSDWMVLRPSLGLGYLAESLKQEEIEHDVLDMNLGYRLKHLLRKIDLFEPDLLGITVISLEYKKTYSLIDAIKENYPKLKIVVGGPHVTSLKKQVLRECKGIDYGVVREGERVLVQLCQLDGGENRIKGLIYKDGASIVDNGNGDYVENLDDIPFPKYEKFELDRYIQEMNIYTSRGCPHRCIFCPNKTLFPRYRARSAENVLGELQYWYDRGYRQFNFDDDNFNLEKERVHRICDGIIRSGMRDLVLRCSNGIRADFVDREMLQHMVEAGFRYIAYGVDAANDRTLRIVKKGENMAAIEDAIRETCALGIGVKLLFVVGFPGETLEDIDDMVQLVQRYPIDDVHFYNLIPYPATEVYDWVQRNDRFLINPEEYLNDISCLHYRPIFDTPELSQDDRIKIFKRLRVVKRQVTREAIKRKLRRFPLMRSTAAWILSSEFAQKRFFKTIIVRKAIEHFRYDFSN